MTLSHPVARGVLLVAMAVLPLAATGCKVDLDDDPTPTAAPTEVTFGVNDIAVGTLIDRSAEAWADLDGWTVELRSDSPDGSESGAEGFVTTEEVQGPDSRRVVTMTGETMVSEEVAIDGRIFMRGTLVSTSIYPSVDAETWIVFSPDAAPPGTPLEQRVRYLTAAPEHPFATVTDGTRALPATPSGETQVEDRACTVYLFTTGSEDVPGITYRIAVDDTWLPCQMTRESGGVVETTTWTYDVPAIEIATPEEAVPVETFPTAP